MQNPYVDGAASLLIGTMLALMAAFLAYETKGLLIGEGYDRKTLTKLRNIISSDPSIERVNTVLTLFFGPEDVMLTAEIKLRDGLTTREIRAGVQRIKQRLTTEYPEIKRVYVASEKLNDDGDGTLPDHGEGD